MRYGCCVNMVTRTQDISGTDIVPILKSLGFDYAELSLCHLCAMSDSEFSGVRPVLTDAGLPIEVCNIINTYREAMELERLTNASRVRCLLDLYH